MGPASAGYQTEQNLCLRFHSRGQAEMIGVLSRAETNRKVFNSSANGERIMENMPDHLLSKDQYLAKKLELLNLEVERLSRLYPEESPVVTGQNETPGSQLDLGGLSSLRLP